jgi:hypothetical protein
MPEDHNGQEEEVLEEQPQGEEQPEDVSTSEEPAEELEETQETQDELPEDAKERTRIQFEKLKKHNQELAEENKRLKGNSQPIPSVLDYLEPANVPHMPQVPQPQYQQQPQYAPPAPQPEPQLVDENGYVNTDVLTKRLEAAERAQKKAEEAEKRALDAESRISRFEQDNETKQLYQAYPELDPLNLDQFNQDAYDLVKNELTSQIVKSGKRDAMKAAERMSKYFRTSAPVNQKVLDQRRQVTTPGTTQRPPTTDFEELKLRSRHDPDALFERLQRINS